MPTPGGLHAHVLDTLGQRIVDGTLAPGTVLRPDDVVAEFGVSRSVVREALRVLQSLGLVEPRQRVGTQVQPSTRWELLAPSVIRWRGTSGAYFTQQRELLDLRLGIEPVAAGLTAEHGGAAADAVLSAAQEMVAAASAGDGRAYLDADVRFHRALLTGSGNAVFAHFAGTVEALLRTRTSESRDTITGWTAGAAARHEAVGRAVVGREARVASAAAADLVRTTRDEFVAEAG
ncbi:GntR family transcriptional regulator [Curtobacterium sp. MCPF17_001]|uniref:FadR/GntR family transcriptional regulator n=1 Tax=Curtobacterium sp. MCPF17_001 TaxID=2175651 RepID=UPI000DA7E4D6|nr:FCD domain-containing protein [Curtobacterium sp. MCPF17_001]PZE62270.1 GntR family transcriptional regulator [Curtobacterium sp. MCPF17_001]